MRLFRLYAYPVEPQRTVESEEFVDPLLEWGSTGKRQRHVRALAKNLLKLWPALWTFVEVPDVEPTDNAAERGLRAPVLYRKLSRQSLARRRTHDRTAALGRPDLPAAVSLALRLPR